MDVEKLSEQLIERRAQRDQLAVECAELEQQLIDASKENNWTRQRVGDKTLVVVTANRRTVDMDIVMKKAGPYAADMVSKRVFNRALYTKAVDSDLLSLDALSVIDQATTTTTTKPYVKVEEDVITESW